MVSARELAEAFTPTGNEVEWARGRSQHDQHLLVLLKSYQRLGYFPKLKQVPDVVVAHLRGAPGGVRTPDRGLRRRPVGGPRSPATTPCRRRPGHGRLV